MATRQHSDQELIEQVGKGNKEAYRKIVDRYAPMVFFIIRRYESNEDNVEDLAQDIFIKAYERLDKFHGNAKFSSWLYVLANNHCTDYARKNRRNSRQNQSISELDEQQVENMMPDGETPEQIVLEQEWDRLLNSAIEQLESDYSESFLLRYRDGMSYKEMADKLNLSVGALKVRVHRARLQLKNLMERSYE